ncbi:MAG: hypothetical protein EBR82_38530 [Caulobacteraceae bacterium]|nr:hypothetical protein [Caulobacteraceae bacterium]
MNKPQNKNQNELGALWKKKSKTGMSFLSGYINDHDGQRIDIVVFANGNKKNEKAPDYRLYVSKPLESNNTKAPVAANKQTVKSKPVVEEVEDDIL